jgi:hypothetical protein
VTRLVRALPLLLVAAVIAGCGSSSSSNQTPTIQKALLTQIADLKPSGPITPGKPVTISFRILQPNTAGTQLVAMTKFKTGPGPHTGVHMIIVRNDLSVIIHRHPPIVPDGVLKQTVVFPKPGPYRMVLDVYPPVSSSAGAGFAQTNFQLFANFKVKGAYKPTPLGAPNKTAVVDRYTFHIVKVVPSPLKAIQSSLIYMTLTDPHGKPVTLTPWYGALAHAIFFHQGRFEYFHTHVCSPGAGGCTSVFAGSKVTGSSATPGHMTVGVLLPDSGTWRLFLQIRQHGKILAAPFVLRVGA